MGAFIKAQRQRENLNWTLGLRRDTDDEDELGRFDIGDGPPANRRSTTITTTATRTLTFNNDSESDDQFPIPVQGREDHHPHWPKQRLETHDVRGREEAPHTTGCALIQGDDVYSQEL